MVRGCAKEDMINAGITEICLNEDIYLRHAYFSDDSTGFVCGGEKNISGSIFRSSDHGITWQKVLHSDKYSFYDISFVNDSTGYACGDSLSLFKTCDSGITWEQFEFTNLPWEPFINPCKAISIINKDTIIATGGEFYMKGIVSITYNAGDSWTHTSYDNEFRSTCFINNTTGFFGGYGVMYKTTDAGQTFNQCKLRDDSFVSIFFTSEQTGYAAGYNGGIYKTTDAGDNWEEIFGHNHALGKRLHFYKIKFYDQNTGFVAGNNGVIMKTKDAGNTWRQIDTGTDRNFYSLHIFNENRILVTAENGRIYIIEL